MRALSTLAALAGAGLLFWGVPGSGYVVAWPALATAKRDVRVFDNFADPQANDDTTPDARWPGWTGAPRAIWKGAAEWGSRLHGSGGGDPTQPDGVGSGGANLDPLFLGLAPGVGAPNDDVASELNGSNAAVIAFTELPPNDGWRVRFYANPWILDDDSAGPAAGAVDLQGIFTHEYGHCLGLDHSTVPGCTMEAAPPSTLDIRSIEADDIAGVRAIYGIAAAGKPEVRALTLSGGQLTLLGSGFGNSVNLEFLGASTFATPASAGGSLVQLGLPAGAQAGDLRLSLASGPAGGAGVSNAFPIDPSSCPPPSTYGVGKLNSQGCLPAIAHSGSPSASAGSGFQISAANVLNNKLGLLIYSHQPAATPFQGGTLWLGGPIKRTPGQNSGGSPMGSNCSGLLGFDFNARIASGVDPTLVAGSAVYAQYIYRDPLGSFGWGLSDALAFTICP
jgi:hypothetical protein